MNSKKMSPLLFGTTFVNLCLPQAEMINLPCFADFFAKNNIHEYTNELICIFEYQMKGQCLSLNLVTTLSLYVEHRPIYY